jgi:hypothetical protein
MFAPVGTARTLPTIASACAIVKGVFERVVNCRGPAAAAARATGDEAIE